MARLLRVQFPGAIYHVSARGNERRLMFRNDVERARFLVQLAESNDDSPILTHSRTEGAATQQPSGNALGRPTTPTTLSPDKGVTLGVLAFQAGDLSGST
ncbi:MAG: hypothetical protein AB9869_33990 [Verrucomicrobiia bacterium]